MKKTISAPCGAASSRQFTLITTTEMVYPAPVKLPDEMRRMEKMLHNNINAAVILSPTNVNNSAVTRELKLVNLDTRQAGSKNKGDGDGSPTPSDKNSTRSSSQDSGVPSNNAIGSRSETKSAILVAAQQEQPIVQVRRKFERFRAKFSMKRVKTGEEEEAVLDGLPPSPLLLTTQSCEGMKKPRHPPDYEVFDPVASCLTRTKTQNDVPNFTSRGTIERTAGQFRPQPMLRTVTCPVEHHVVSYISPPLGDFRHTAHLGHHGESFGDLSFLNSTKMEYSDKNAGLRLDAAKL